MFQVGEFVYVVEGTCGIPLPSGLLPMDSPNVLRISSTLKGKVNERGKNETGKTSSFIMH